MASVMDSNPWPKLKEVLPDNYFCDICDISMKFRDHKTHLRGKKHRVKEAELTKPNDPTPGAGDANGGWAAAPTGEPAAEGCFNCRQPGHRKTECTEPRSMRNVECRKCNQKGHMGKDCPTAQSSKVCRNCNQEGHFAKECPEPRSEASFQCRNCDQFGHRAKDCPAPKDWSKVTCNNCGEKGHTVKRCKEPLKEDAGSEAFGGSAGGAEGAPAIAGDWAAAEPISGGWAADGDAAAPAAAEAEGADAGWNGGGGDVDW